MQGKSCLLAQVLNGVNRNGSGTASLRPASSSLGSSTSCTSTPQILQTPRAGLTTRLGDFATNCHESCGLGLSHLLL